jgi:hypothetical protein
MGHGRSSTRGGEGARPERLGEGVVEDINHYVKEEGGEGISLAEITATLDPSSSNPIEEDRGLTCFIEARNLDAPQGGTLFPRGYNPERPN